MLCYECSKAGKNREAVGLCHHCSAALCTDHVSIITDPVTTAYPVFKKLVLPKKARLLLSGTCLDALGQVGTETMAPWMLEESCVSSIG